MLFGAGLHIDSDGLFGRTGWIAEAVLTDDESDEILDLFDCVC